MSQELTTTNGVQRQLLRPAEMESMAKHFVASGFFKDANDISKAIVKITAGQEVGLPPFASMNSIYIVQGKVMMGGAALAALVKASPKYDYRVLEKSAAVCRIEFFEDGQSVGIETFTDTDAKTAGTQNMAKFPKNMLFNRCISNGQKTYCPDLMMGVRVYTPDEFGMSEEEAAKQDRKESQLKAWAKDSTHGQKTALRRRLEAIAKLDDESSEKAKKTLSVIDTFDSARLSACEGWVEAVEESLGIEAPKGDEVTFEMLPMEELKTAMQNAGAKTQPLEPPTPTNP